MSNGPDITAQEYFYRAIRAAVASTTPVETRPRTNGQIPYVFVGEAGLAEHPVGYDIELDVEIWSQKEGPVQCKQLQNAVRGALDGLIHTTSTESDSATVWRFVLIYEDSSRTQFEPSNSVWHGTQRFRALVELSA